LQAPDREGAAWLAPEAARVSQAMVDRTLAWIDAKVCAIDAAIRRKSNTPRSVSHQVCVLHVLDLNRFAAHCSLAAARAGFGVFRLELGATGTNQLMREGSRPAA
jgi:hypothetical protein